MAQLMKLHTMTSVLEVLRINCEDTVLAVAFSADGRYFATAGLDAIAQVWTVDSGRNVLCVNHEDIIVAIAFSSDGRYLATASEDSTAQVWEVKTGRRVACLIHEDSVCDVAFSFGGKCVVTTTGSKVFPQSVDKATTATVWDVMTAQKIRAITHEPGASAFAFSPIRRHIAIATLDGAIGIWAIDESQQFMSRSYKSKAEGSVALLSNAKNSARVGLLENMCVWQANTSSPVTRMIQEHPATAATFSPNAQYLATVSLDNSVRVWEVMSGLEIARLTHEQQINAVAFSPDGRYLATASDDQTTRILEVSSSREIARLTFDNKVNAIAFSSSGKLLATATGDLMSGRQDNCTRLWLWQPEDVVVGII